MRILFLLQTDRSFGEITHLRVLRRIGLRHHLDLQLALISLLVTWDSGGVNRTLEKRFVAASLPGIPSFLHLVDQHRLGVLLLVGVCVMLVRIVLSLNLVNLMIRDIFLVDALLIGALVSVQLLAVGAFHVLDSDGRGNGQQGDVAERLSDRLLSELLLALVRVSGSHFLFAVIEFVLLTGVLEHVEVLELLLVALQLGVGGVVVADLRGVRAFVRPRQQLALDSLAVLAHDLVVLFASRVGIVLPHVSDQIVLALYRSVFASSNCSFTNWVYLPHLDHRGFLIDLVANLITIFINGAIRCCSSLAIRIGVHSRICLLQIICSVICWSTRVAKSC